MWMGKISYFLSKGWSNLLGVLPEEADKVIFTYDVWPFPSVLAQRNLQIDIDFQQVAISTWKHSLGSLDCARGGEIKIKINAPEISCVMMRLSINLWRLSTWPMSMNDCSGGRSWGRYSVRKHSMCQRWLFKDNSSERFTYLPGVLLSYHSLQVMNKYEFVPKMPNSSDLELVFDTSFHDVQPHLFKVWSTEMFFTFSQICVAGVSQHCQCGQPRCGDQHGEEAPEGHPCHLEEGEKEEPERTIIMKKRRSGE